MGSEAAVLAGPEPALGAGSPLFSYAWGTELLVFANGSGASWFGEPLDFKLLENPLPVIIHQPEK